MTDTFKRKEQKYLLTAFQRKAFEQAFRDHMDEDVHGESLIRNIYFDTESGLLIRRSLEKPVYKEKLRIRSYKQLTDGDKAFLELKKKYKGIVYKRRIETNEKDFLDYLEGKRSFPEEGQIAREIDYFCRFYQDIGPRIFLCYDRCAYYGKDDENFRVTFDRNIRWRTEDLSLFGEAGGEDLLQEGESLMEVKAANAMPLWFVGLLSRLRLRKVSFSKYGSAYLRFIERKGSIRYA